MQYNIITKTMKCPKCDKCININDGGIRVLTYTFCSIDCFKFYFTLSQLKQLYAIQIHKNKL